LAIFVAVAAVLERRMPTHYVIYTVQQNRPSCSPSQHREFVRRTLQTTCCTIYDFYVMQKYAQYRLFKIELSPILGICCNSRTQISRRHSRKHRLRNRVSFTVRGIPWYSNVYNTGKVPTSYRYGLDRISGKLNWSFPCCNAFPVMPRFGSCGRITDIFTSLDITITSPCSCVVTFYRRAVRLWPYNVGTYIIIHSVTTPNNFFTSHYYYYRYYHIDNVILHHTTTDYARVRFRRSDASGAAAAHQPGTTGFTYSVMQSLQSSPSLSFRRIFYRPSI